MPESKQPYRTPYCAACGEPVPAGRRFSCSTKHSKQAAKIRYRQRTYRRSARLILDDVDEMAVERACMGQRVTLNRGERWAVIARLNGYVLQAVIAERCGVSERTVERDKVKALSRR